MVKTNMYVDSKYQWNCFIGCKFKCKYCIPSFQRQMKRQKHRCMDCYNYIPHFHEERLTNRLPRTYGDEFIWVGSSGDISFCELEDMDKILLKIEEYPNRTFFFQTKNPKYFQQFDFPKNVILGITLESDRDWCSITKAPDPYKRYKDFLKVDHLRKIVTIEPILDFDGFIIDWVRAIAPERVYIGFDTKNCNLPEPSKEKTLRLITTLAWFTSVRLKYIKYDIVGYK